MQDWLEGLTGIHAAPANFRATVNYSALSKKEQQRFEEQSIGRHPLVIRHPVSSQRILFANPTYTTGIEGLSARESRMLLRFLFTEATRPDFIYRHHWEMGDLVMWDELTTMHLGPGIFRRTPVRQIYAGLTRPTAANDPRSSQDRPRQPRPGGEADRNIDPAVDRRDGRVGPRQRLAHSGNPARIDTVLTISSNIIRARNEPITVNTGAEADMAIG